MTAAFLGLSLALLSKPHQFLQRVVQSTEWFSLAFQALYIEWKLEQPE
jgi:hypothetical protein